MFRSVVFPLCVLVHLLWRKISCVNLVVSNPPTLPFVPFLLKWLFGMPYVHVVHDIYPEIAERLSFLRQGSLIARMWN